MGHFPLGQGFAAAQPIAQLDYQQFPVRQDLLHGLVEPCGIFPGAEVFKQIVVGADDIHQGEGVAILAGFYVIERRRRWTFFDCESASGFHLLPPPQCVFALSVDTTEFGKSSSYSTSE